MSDRENAVTLKGRVLAELLAANPHGRLKAVEYGSFGELRRIEWHDEPEESCADDAAGAGTPGGETT